jgi:MFS family permease
MAFGSYRSLFGEPRWRRSAILGTLLCIAGVVGLWGIGFFAPELVNPVIAKTLGAQGLTQTQIEVSQQNWVGVNSIVQNVGGFFGMVAFTWLAQRIGRKRSFLLAFPAAMFATIFYFQSFNGVSDIWMSGIMGACQLTLFAGFAIYLPELFPLRLRSTGTSFCYNVGRFIAASGPLTFGTLQRLLVPKGADAEAKLSAIRDAASWMSCIFLLGMVATLLLPETRGQPLPEDLPQNE